MAKLVEIPSKAKKAPVFSRYLQVAAYCRVSTEQEEQRGSLEAQEAYYSQVIAQNPYWTNAGVFSDRATVLNVKERSEFQAMMRKCRKGKVNLILTKSISRFGRNTLDMLKPSENSKPLKLKFTLKRKTYGSVSRNWKCFCPFIVLLPNRKARA